MTTYLVPAGYGEAELIEKRSRFIGRVWRTDTEQEALERLREIRERHRDATHNVYAYIIRDNNITRYSDDGEPSGTSGQPTLNVFAAGGIQNVCCVVTRYFGGTLLGAGGLVRAYSKAAKLALDAAGIEHMAQWQTFLISCGYSFFERAMRVLDEFEAVVSETDFGADVAIDCSVRADKAEEFTAKLIDLSCGEVFLEAGESKFMGIRVKSEPEMDE